MNWTNNRQRGRPLDDDLNDKYADSDGADKIVGHLKHAVLGFEIDFSHSVDVDGYRPTRRFPLTPFMPFQTVWFE